MLIPVTWRNRKTTYRAVVINVADICSNARCTTDIVETERTREAILRSKESGRAMPPPAASTATFVYRAGLVEKARVCADRRRAAERVNMKKRRRVMIVSWRCERKLRQLTPMCRSSTRSPYSDLRAPRRTTRPWMNAHTHRGHWHLSWPGYFFL